MRDVGCYLSQEEKKAVTDYIFKGEQVKIVTTLKESKRIELRHKLSARKPDTTLTYRMYLEKNGITCPIDAFLTTLSAALEDKKYRFLGHGHDGLFGVLKRRLDICKQPCPCPADCL